jgi:enoyl-CoA hydratase
MVEERGAVAVVRLDHGKVNALDLDLLRAITATMAELAEAPAVVLTGSRTVFSAGVDLRQIMAGGVPYVRAFLPALSAAFLAVFDQPRPVVAAVNGHALAGGCVLAAAGDLRLMSGGTIGLTELLVGVPFPITPLEIMRYAAGPAAGLLALTGRALDPAEARRIGLVDAVVEPADLLAEACRRATDLARIPAAAYALTKEQLHRPTRRGSRSSGWPTTPAPSRCGRTSPCTTPSPATWPGWASAGPAPTRRADHRWLRRFTDVADCRREQRDVDGRHYGRRERGDRRASSYRVLPHRAELARHIRAPGRRGPIGRPYRTVRSPGTPRDRPCPPSQPTRPATPAVAAVRRTWPRFGPAGQPASQRVWYPYCRRRWPVASRG